MSAEIASVPSWKLALMERKRRQDKDSSTAGCSTAYGRGENCDSMTGVSTWKRDMLVQKQQQKNTFVFVGRSSAQSTTDSQQDQPEPSFGTRADSKSVLTNGRVASSVQSSGLDHHESDACRKQHSCSEDTKGPVIDFDASDIQLLEERLLPIQANPILRLDIEKRQHASVHTARISSGGSSRLGSTMVNGNATRISTVEDQSCTYQNGFQSTADIENEDVFGEGGAVEDEVQYGKGFVHKLLMKFSHLSSNENAAASRNHAGKSRHSSSGETPHSTSISPRNNPRSPTTDPENIILSKGISRVKFHSVDDLLREAQFQPAKSDEDGECESGRNMMNGDCVVRHPSPELLSVGQGEKVDDEVLPLANIVSNTRSLFERLVTSPVSPAPAISPKPPALYASSRHNNNTAAANLPNNRFSFGQQVERRKEHEKRLSAGPAVQVETLSQEISQPRPQTAISAPGFAVDPTAAKEETDKNMNNVVRNTSSGSLPSASLPANTTVIVVRNSYPGNSRDVVSRKSTDSYESKLNSDKNSSDVSERIGDVGDVQKIFSQIDLDALPLKPSDVAKSSTTSMNGISKKMYVDKLSDVSNRIENEPVPVVSSHVDVSAPEKKPSFVKQTPTETAVTAEKSSSVGPAVSKPGGLVGSNQRSGLVNEKQNSDSSSTVIGKVDPVVKKTTPAADISSRTVTEKSVAKNNASQSQKNSSRPGMLLIRPASNLVAAKTKSEYLDLTKYNDVRKGEFAPAAKRPVSATRAEEDGADEADGMNGSDVEQPDSAAERVMFAGAGVNIGRSLLSKTKQGRQLQINFDDATTRTFEYPSEQSLMDATPATPGYMDYEGEDVPDYSVGGSSGLLTAPSIVAAGALSSYRSRTQVDYQFGMHVTEEKKETMSGKPANKAPTTQTLPPTENESASWSKGTSSSDLLF